MNQELCKRICECLQTDECITHCNYGPCGTCSRLTNYLEATGCVILPWKIGDSVYYITNKDTIDTDTIIRLTITRTGVNPILERHTTDFWKYFKDRWFRTEEEAKIYLKEKRKSK